MSKTTDRRGFLKSSVAAGGAALAALGSFEEKALSAELDGAGNAGVPAPAAAPLSIPKGRIKGLEISRVIGGAAAESHPTKWGT